MVRKGVAPPSDRNFGLAVAANHEASYTLALEAATSGAVGLSVRHAAANRAAAISARVCTGCLTMSLEFFMLCSYGQISSLVRGRMIGGADSGPSQSACSPQDRGEDAVRLAAATLTASSLAGRYRSLPPAPPC